jgi:hypothetical protein
LFRNDEEAVRAQAGTEINAGGKARAAKLFPAKRKSIARKAAQKRWKSAAK